MSTPPDDPQRNASRAIRPLYEQHGATEYYAAHGVTYRNPHEPVIREALRMGVFDSRPLHALAFAVEPEESERSSG